MTRNIFIFIFALFLLPISLYSVENETIQTSTGAILEFSFRVYQPGEIILVTFKENPLVKKVTIRFLGKKYVLEREGSASPFALIGLDLSLLSKNYLMKISVEKTDGKSENIWKKIPVLRKEFPIKELWVKEEYIKPPPEARERIQREAELVEAVYSFPSPEWLAEEKFIFPFSAVVEPNFGERRLYNNEFHSIHSGVDIEAPFGSPILASNSGKVVLTSDLYFAGKTVIIDHGLGLFSFYCHFSEIKVKRGDLVRKGDTIGLAGATGRVTGPHLHWGVKIYNNRVDPFSLLSLSLD